MAGMPIHQESFQVRTRGETDVLDLTPRLIEVVQKSGLRRGLATVFLSGSTAGITTLEYEPGLVEDIQRAAGRWAPKGEAYSHNRGGEDNGRSHVLSSLVGTSFSVPVEEGRPVLGTWQQVVLLDFDTRPRTRTVTVQVLGE